MEQGNLESHVSNLLAVHTEQLILTTPVRTVNFLIRAE
jgi:hypothetical protein